MSMFQTFERLPHCTVPSQHRAGVRGDLSDACLTHSVACGTYQIVVWAYVTRVLVTLETDTAHANNISCWHQPLGVAGANSLTCWAWLTFTPLLSQLGIVLIGVYAWQFEWKRVCLCVLPLHLCPHITHHSLLVNVCICMRSRVRSRVWICIKVRNSRTRAAVSKW